MVWLNVHLFSWRLVLIIYLSLWAVIRCTLLHFLVIFWLQMSCCRLFYTNYEDPDISTVSIWNAWFHGLLFSDWDIYDMLWCSHFCVTIPKGVTLGGKLTMNSNISPLMKGWSEISIFMLEGRKYLCQA